MANGPDSDAASSTTTPASLASPASPASSLLAAAESLLRAGHTPVHLTPAMARALTEQREQGCAGGPLVPWAPGGPLVQQQAAVAPVPAPGPPLPCRWMLHNVLARFRCGTTINPREVALKFCNTEWHPRQPGKVYIRLQRPARATCVIFNTGSVVTLGTKTLQATKAVAKKCAQMLHHINREVKFQHYLVANLVATADAGFPIDLERLHMSLLECRSRYNPELFGALIYSMDEPKVTCNVFANGRLGLTGAKTTADLDAALQRLLLLLLPCRLQSPFAIAPAPEPRSEPNQLSPPDKREVGEVEAEEEGGWDPDMLQATLDSLLAMEEDQEVDGGGADNLS